jgi:hypothetical protein
LRHNSPARRPCTRWKRGFWRGLIPTIASSREVPLMASRDIASNIASGMLHCVLRSAFAGLASSMLLVALVWFVS